MTLRLKILRAVLAIAGELTKSSLVDGMDLLPYRAGSDLGQRSAWYMPTTTSHFELL